jgi:transposase
MNKEFDSFPSQECSKANSEAQNIDVPVGKQGRKARIVLANRSLTIPQQTTIDDLLPEKHLARNVWNYVSGLDLTIYLSNIKSVEGRPGRSAIDPKILLSLWLFATLKGIGSARMIYEYCREHIAFRWICGGINVNYHTISDFRSNQMEQLDSLITQSVSILSKKGIISLEETSQDGMRTRANAGGSSFRRNETLQDHLIFAEKLIDDLKNDAKKKSSGCKSEIIPKELRFVEKKRKDRKSY